MMRDVVCCCIACSYKSVARSERDRYCYVVTMYDTSFTSEDNIMESKYIINVARPTGTGWDGQPSYTHHFRIEKCGIIGLASFVAEVQGIANELRAAYPNHMIEVTSWEAKGKITDI